MKFLSFLFAKKETEQVTTTHQQDSDVIINCAECWNEDNSQVHDESTSKDF